ncbi:MAG: hypothetical protein GEV08_10270 [Acidimicrobiia bacterium]|nr:hypothetical protein [Acidimicrobiia bacterium]
MRLDRISLQLADGEVRTFDFHRGLTVVEAEAGGEGILARALLGTLSSAGDGVHVELTLDDGTGQVVFRPSGAAHRVIDVATSADRTAAYAQPGGAVDALAPYRSGSRHPAADLVLGGDDLREGDPTEAWIAHLATADPAVLFGAATEEARAEQDLRQASASARPTPDTPTAGAGHSPPRRRASSAERRYRVLLPTTAVVGSGMAVGAAVGVDTLGTGGSLALIGGSLGLVAATLLYGRKVNATLRAAGPAAPGAGPDTAGVDRRAAAALAEAAGRYQRASSAWAELAGPIPAPWVLGERDRIERTARLRQRVAPGQPGVETLAAAAEASAVIAGLTVAWPRATPQDRAPRRSPCSSTTPSAGSRGRTRPRFSSSWAAWPPTTSSCSSPPTARSCPGPASRPWPALSGPSPPPPRRANGPRLAGRPAPPGRADAAPRPS